jgi:uncharacterized protein (TIGR00730 family)
MAAQSRPGERIGRYRTGDEELDRELLSVLDRLGVEDDRDQLFEIMVSAVLLAQDGADRLDLKITNAALKEMRRAFRAFAPYHDLPKITIFGSARTAPTDPLYEQTRELAATMADRGWMVVTGAGPGIMAAGLEGAGREWSFGVSIRLPVEESANEFIAGDDKLVSMKYFFTRKLELIKESRGFMILPGGFGTLDEAFELLTLQQTGKSVPAPIVFLETPGGTYWHHWRSFLAEEVAPRGLIDEEDLDFFLVTDDARAAADEIVGFYRNYHSIRWVGRTLVVRLRAEPTDEELARLREEFTDLVVEGTIDKVEPLPPEVQDDDDLDLPRLAFVFDVHRYGRLRALINALNALPSAPPPGQPPPP